MRFRVQRTMRLPLIEQRLEIIEHQTIVLRLQLKDSQLLFQIQIQELSVHQEYRLSLVEVLVNLVVLIPIFQEEARLLRCGVRLLQPVEVLVLQVVEEAQVATQAEEEGNKTFLINKNECFNNTRFYLLSSKIVSTIRKQRNSYLYVSFIQGFVN